MRFGVIGAGGHWGPKWVRILNQLHVLSAVCDEDATQLNRIADELALDRSKVRLADDYRRLLEMELDGVFIVTPPDTHEQIAVAAIRRGAHVFIEKPMAETEAECRRIKEAAAPSDRCVMVGHTFVYHPAVRKFKSLMPRIGRLRTLYTVRGNFGIYQQVGIVQDLLPHDLSIFDYFCAAQPRNIRADVNPHQDVAYVSADYGGVQCSAFLSWSYPEKTRRLIAVGDAGILEWDLSWSYLELHHKWVKPSGGQRLEHFDQGTERIELTDFSEPLMNEALHFIECIESGKEPFTGVEAGIHVVKGLEQCR